MNTIFSHAMNAIKTNPKATNNEVSDRRVGYSNRDSDVRDPGSILERIKLNKKHGKTIKSITLRKNYEEDSERKFEIKTIQKKVITKDISNLKNPLKKSSADDLWKHDLYDGPVVSNSNNMHCTVFVRNLPETISSQHLRDILTNDNFVVGIRIDNGTAEINFSRKDAAQKAAEELNGKIIRGNKLKAAVMGEINASMNIKSSRVIDRSQEKKQEVKEERGTFKTKMHIDAEDERKPSILSRIKKSH